MNINLFVKSILLILALALTGCGKDERLENTIPESEQLLLVNNALANASEKDIEKKDMPMWLSEFIDSLEPDNLRNVAAYQANWKGEVVYYVTDDYFSCVFCTTFKSDGERFDWSEIDPKEFWESATDWECIFLSPFKIIN